MDLCKGRISPTALQISPQIRQNPSLTIFVFFVLTPFSPQGYEEETGENIRRYLEQRPGVRLAADESITCLALLGHTLLLVGVF